MPEVEHSTRKYSKASVLKKPMVLKVTVSTVKPVLKKANGTQNFGLSVCASICIEVIVHLCFECSLLEGCYIEILLHIFRMVLEIKKQTNF
jgi:hypothetical protein